MNRLLQCSLAVSASFLLTGCASMVVKLSGDKGLNYQAAWTDDTGNHTQRGKLPETFKIRDEKYVGWFQNTTSAGEFRVRVYRGWSLLVDETVINSAQRITVEKKGNGVSVSK